MEVYKLNKKDKYLFYVQKFLDLIENIEDVELRDDVRNSFFSSIRAICDIAEFDINSLGKN